MNQWLTTLSSANKLAKRRKRSGRNKSLRRGLQPLMERLENRIALSGLSPLAQSTQNIDTSLTAEELAQSLVGPGVSVSNVVFTGNAVSRGSFDFGDPTVIGFDQGIVMSSGKADDVVGRNRNDDTSTDFTSAGDTDLDSLSGFPTFDAAVLEFDFEPSANQVVFTYTFASDEYPEWVQTPYNDVFAFYVNGTNYATVRQVAGDPTAPFVPVAVNNINNSNPVQFPPPDPMRPDLFRANYFNPDGPSVIDLELDGITKVLTFQAPVNPGVTNHMKLAIADASDGIYDSAVFIQSGSLVSNENPVADLSVEPEQGAAPLTITAIIEGEDPNGLPITYTIDWGDSTPNSTGPLNEPFDENEKTALVDHTYTTPGEYVITLTVSNGTLSGTSSEDIHVTGVSTAPDTTITVRPPDPSNDSTPTFSFTSTQSGSTFEYQIDGGVFTPASGSDVTLGPLADASHTLQVRAVNSAGTPDPTPATYSWVVDTVAPDTLITDQPADPSNDTTPSFSFGSTQPSSTFEYQLDGAGFVPGASGVTLGPLADGSHTFEVRATDAAGNLDPTAAIYTWTIDTAAEVVGRYVFYNNSKFDGNNPAANANDAAAIATDKVALLPGGTSTFVNYTSYNRGLNGIMLDIANLPATAALSIADFDFKIGNSNTPTEWSALAVMPEVTVSPGAGFKGSTRITLIWPDLAIRKSWLQITVNANSDTGLLIPDVFYFGNAVGESGNVPGDYSVSITDELLARNNPVSVNPGTQVTNRFDYNRDGTVSVVDQLLARNNITTAASKLKQITVPVAVLRAQGLGDPSISMLSTTLQPSALSESISSAGYSAAAFARPQQLDASTVDRLFASNLDYSFDSYSSRRTLKAVNERTTDTMADLVAGRMASRYY